MIFVATLLTSTSYAPFYKPTPNGESAAAWGGAHTAKWRSHYVYATVAETDH